MFTVARRWKPPKCPLREGWINKMCYIHTMFSLRKKGKFPTHVATWLNLEDGIVNKICQSQKKTNTI